MNQEQKINEDSKRCSTSNCSKDGKIFLCNECGFISGTKITGTYHMRKSHLGVSTILDLFCHDCSVAATIKVNYLNFHLFRKLSCSFKIVCLFVWTSAKKDAAGPNKIFTLGIRVVNLGSVAFDNPIFSKGLTKSSPIISILGCFA